jgi:hypothetical protein
VAVFGANVRGVGVVDLGASGKDSKVGVKERCCVTRCISGKFVFGGGQHDRSHIISLGPLDGLQDFTCQLRALCLVVGPGGVIHRIVEERSEPGCRCGRVQIVEMAKYSSDVFRRVVAPVWLGVACSQVEPDVVRWFWLQLKFSGQFCPARHERGASHELVYSFNHWTIVAHQQCSTRVRV